MKKDGAVFKSDGFPAEGTRCNTPPLHCLESLHFQNKEENCTCTSVCFLVFVSLA